MKRLIILALLAAAALAQSTAVFPGRTATYQDLLVARNDSGSPLTSPIDSTTLSIQVADGSQFRAFQAVWIDSEQVLICSAASNTLTICASGRGWDGTYASAHLSGAMVEDQVSAGHHNALAAEIKAIEEALGADLSNIVLPDGGTYDLSVTGSAGSVLWTGVSGRPTALSAFTNDSGFITSSAVPTKVSDLSNDTGFITSAGAAASAGQWTGTRQINWVFGGDPGQTVPVTTVKGVWKADAVQATIVAVSCKVDTGTATMKLINDAGSDIHAAVSCGTSWTSPGSITITNIDYNGAIGFTTTSVSGAHNLSFSVRYTPRY